MIKFKKAFSILLLLLLGSLNVWGTVKLGSSLDSILQLAVSENIDLNEIKISLKQVDGKILKMVTWSDRLYFLYSDKVCGYMMDKNKNEEIDEALSDNYDGMLGFDFYLNDSWLSDMTISREKDIFYCLIKDVYFAFNKEYILYFMYADYKDFEIGDLIKLLPYCYYLENPIYFQNLLHLIKTKCISTADLDQNLAKDQQLMMSLFSELVRSCKVNQFEVKKSYHRFFAKNENVIAFNDHGFMRIKDYDNVVVKVRDTAKNVRLSAETPTSDIITHMRDSISKSRVHLDFITPFVDTSFYMNVENKNLFILPRNIASLFKFLDVRRCRDKSDFRKRNKYFGYLCVDKGSGKISFDNSPYVVSLYLSDRDEKLPIRSLVHFFFSNVEIIAEFERRNDKWVLLWYEKEVITSQVFVCESKTEKAIPQIFVSKNASRGLRKQ